MPENRYKKNNNKALAELVIKIRDLYMYICVINVVLEIGFNLCKFDCDPHTSLENGYKHSNRKK